MMRTRKQSRLKRALRTRMKIRELQMHRLSVFRTPKHMYAQIMSPAADRVLATASTLDETLRNQPGGTVGQAAAVGRLIAERALSQGIDRVAFDRSGYRYHGRVMALAQAVRDAGLRC